MLRTVRIAVFSDVHADLQSLQRVLSAIRDLGPDEVWCLGDTVGFPGSDPAKAVDLVRGTCSLVLAGNHDAWVTGSLSLDLLPLPRWQAELRWQHRQLSAEQLAWLDDRAPYVRRAELELWHGSAEDPLSGSLFTPADASEHLDRQRSALGLVGHTHRPGAWHIDRSALGWSDPPLEELDLSGRERWVLNPGAVFGAGSWLELDLAARVAKWHLS